jgi:hypothetical protein
LFFQIALALAGDKFYLVDAEIVCDVVLVNFKCEISYRIIQCSTQYNCQEEYAPKNPHTGTKVGQKIANKKSWTNIHD